MTIGSTGSIGGVANLSALLGSTGVGAGTTAASLVAAFAPAAAGTGQSSSTTATSSTANQLSNPQLFLQLLIAELQNQNPTSPTNPATIMQETSQLSQMEAVNQMSTAVAAEQSAVQAEEAANLIGKSITATVAGVPVGGAVTDVLLSSGGTPVLDVGGTQVPLSSVTKIGS